ncbi:13031_t:CDS:2 [Entrophospora sp. SA101]|nr:13031_t:CDS:2 [Entrophospora sp. SA101]
MRANKELAAKVGLLPNMRIYKFFQTTYGYYKGKRYHQGEKIRKPDYYTHSSTMTMIRAGDYEKFAHQAKLPWNKEINKYALGEEAGEKIRAKISSSSFSSTLSSEDAMARYADY